jgi:membrane protein
MSGHTTLAEDKSKAKRAAGRVDEFQQRHRTLGFPIAVWRKFGEDQAGNLAALIAYWAFFSLFPLLLVAVTVIGFVGISTGTFSSVISTFPLVGTSVTSINGSWWALIAGIATALWSGLAVVRAIQTAFDSIWEVPMAERPSFVSKLLSGTRALSVLGTGFIVSLGLSGIATGGQAIKVTLPLWARLLIGLATIALDVLGFALAYRWLTKRELTFRDVLPGAIFAGVLFFFLELAGSALVTHGAQGHTGAAGQVSTVLGMLWWFALQATVVLYGAEINVVRVERLWPRGLVDVSDPPASRRNENS